MKFRIEQTWLTDDQGRVLNDRESCRLYVRDAANVDDAIQQFITEDNASVLGEILKLPGFQAVATVRRNNGIYTLQLFPASDKYERA
jgi:hypothetical protein